MAHTIIFKRESFGGNTICPLVDKIRDVAKAEKWTGMAGFKEWAKITYNAKLRSGKWNDWTSINFKTEQDMDRFKQDFGGWDQ